MLHQFARISFFGQLHNITHQALREMDRYDRHRPCLSGSEWVNVSLQKKNDVKTSVFLSVFLFCLFSEEAFVFSLMSVISKCFDHFERL